MRDSRTPEQQEAFLSRWSRLKREQEGEAPAKDLVAPSAAVQPAGGTAEAPPRPLSDADMPPLDSLGADSDYSGFLSEGVSKELRELALRKLFSLPEFNQLDGLNDYDEDFTKLEPLGNTITYQMRQWMARDAERAEADGAVAAAPPGPSEEGMNAAIEEGSDRTVQPEGVEQDGQPELDPRDEG